MKRMIVTHGLAAALKAEGFPLPDECSEVRLVMTAHAALVLQFDVFVSADNLARMGRAFLRVAALDEDQSTINPPPVNIP